MFLNKNQYQKLLQKQILYIFEAEYKTDSQNHSLVVLACVCLDYIVNPKRCEFVHFNRAMYSITSWCFFCERTKSVSLTLMTERRASLLICGHQSNHHLAASLHSTGSRPTDRESDITLTGQPRASISQQSPESFRSKMLCFPAPEKEVRGSMNLNS